MLTIVMAVFMVLLTLAMVGLFAMMGELVTRVDAASQASAPPPTDDWTEEMELSSRLAPEWWPPELKSTKDARYGVVIILSTSCRSCDRFTDGRLEALDGLYPSFVISCPSLRRAEGFLARHPILANGWPVYLDPKGQWSRDELGLDVSPAAVLLENGQPITGFTMSSPESLAAVVREKVASN